MDGERGIEIIRPIPVSSEGLDLEINSSVIGVYDKGMLYEPQQLPFWPQLMMSRR